MCAKVVYLNACSGDSLFSLPQACVSLLRPTLESINSIHLLLQGTLCGRCAAFPWSQGHGIKILACEVSPSNSPAPFVFV